MVLGRLRRTRQSKVVEESKARSGKKRLDGTVSMSSGSSNCRSKPKNTRSSSMRVSSLEDSLHRSGLSQSKRGSNNQKRISFGTICVRDYERVASDNPSVSRGVPIGLGWKFYEYEAIQFDDFERHRERRSKAEMVMSAEDRQWLLRKEWEVSQKEIASSVRQAIKVKNQRRQTIMNDKDALILRWRKTMEVLEGCFAPISGAWKKEDTLMYQQDHMSQASECSQKATLDETRHKGAPVVIEDEVEDDELAGTVDTSLASGDQYQQSVSP